MKDRSTYFRKGLIFSLYFIAITFPFPAKVSNWAIGLMLICWAMNWLLHPSAMIWNKMGKWSKYTLLSFVLFFLMHLISLFYTDNLSSGMRNIEGKLSLLLFPLVLYSVRLSESEVWGILRAYMISIGFSTLFLLAHSVYYFIEAGQWLTYHDFTDPFSAHAVFYSYFLFACLLLAIYRLTKLGLSRELLYLYFLLILICLTGLLFAASKNVTVVSVILGLILFFRRYLKRGLKSRELILIVSVGTLAGLGAMQLESVKIRMAELFSTSGIENLEKIRKGETISEEDNHNFNGTSLRLTFWYLGVQKILDEEKIYLGLSPGDRRDKMNQRYLEVGMRPYQDYNLHNQFIQVFVELGLVGILIYFSLHIFLFTDAYRSSNQLLLIFLLAFVIFQLTESVLERNKVIVFFLFFITLLQQLNQSLQYENRNLGN